VGAGAQAVQCLARLGRGELQGDVGVAGAERGRGPRYEGGSGGRERREPDVAAAQAGDAGDFGFGVMDGGQDPAGVADQRQASLGEPGLPPGPPDEAGADLALEGGDLLGDRRLGVVHRLRRHGERAVAFHRLQHTEPLHVQH
jgi:hypothetical protein